MSKYVHTTNIHNTDAASEVVPLIMQKYNPKSVVDVGCGIATWLEVFQKHGVNSILGIDGDYVKREQLHIADEYFLAKDLELPLNLNAKFDLAICLEVAEHLKPEAAETFIDSLTQLSDVVIFSAAIPGQGGQNHINEQWLTYWEKLFNSRGFFLDDWLRSKIWNKSTVEFWYKQNMVTFHKNSSTNSELIKNIVHPELFSQKITILEKTNSALADKNKRLTHILEKYSLDIDGNFKVKKLMDKNITKLKKIYRLIKPKK
jgi:SAM-dependent methyltransferase